MEIIGRQKEVAALNDMLNHQEAQFTVVYGRRRVGKTYLITNLFEKHKNCIFLKVVGMKDGPIQEQLNEFISAVSEVFYGGIELMTVKTWMDAFKTLNKAIKGIDNKKIILFFDESPWMVTPKSRLLSTLEYYWNRYWVDNPSIK